MDGVTATRRLKETLLSARSCADYLHDDEFIPEVRAAQLAVVERCILEQAL